MRIIGIDPGSRLTGFGCIDVSGRSLKYVDHGTVRMDPKAPFYERLLVLHTELSQTIQRLKPQVIAVEKVFFAKNAVSALKLGQARGVVLLCGASAGLKLYEYSANEIKLAVSGYGHADKSQLARMVQWILGAREFDSTDASDALALAICHGLRADTPLARIDGPAAS